MKRIISVFLILLLLLPAGCKKQPTETASPGEVVEKEETGTSDTVVEKEEADTSIKTPSEPERHPAVTPESEPEEESPQPVVPDSDEEGTPSPEEEEKAARIEKCLKEANEVYDRMERENNIRFVLHIYLNDYPTGGFYDEPLDPMPEFPGIEAYDIRESKNMDTSIWESRYSHTIVIGLKNMSREATIDSIRKIMILDYVYNVKINRSVYYLAG